MSSAPPPPPSSPTLLRSQGSVSSDARDHLAQVMEDFMPLLEGDERQAANREEALAMLNDVLGDLEKHTRGILDSSTHVLGDLFSMDSAPVDLSEDGAAADSSDDAPPPPPPSPHTASTGCGNVSYAGKSPSSLESGLPMLSEAIVMWGAMESETIQTCKKAANALGLPAPPPFHLGGNVGVIEATTSGAIPARSLADVAYWLRAHKLRVLQNAFHDAAIDGIALEVLRKHWLRDPIGFAHVAEKRLNCKNCQAMALGAALSRLETYIWPSLEEAKREERCRRASQILQTGNLFSSHSFSRTISVPSLALFPFNLHNQEYIDMFLFI